MAAEQLNLGKKSQFDKNRIEFYISNNNTEDKAIKVAIVLTKGNLVELYFRIKIDGKIASKNVKLQNTIVSGQMALLNVELFQAYKYNVLTDSIEVEIVKARSKGVNAFNVGY